ncbi:MAG TPA: NfeD family protein [Acidimicrobiales bacterium]|nr:NfeD family protein [Acidimicrobiales bacterium]
MHLGSPDSWRVIWVVAAGVFLVGEMAHRLRLWFLPVAVGAVAAAVVAWAGVAVSIEWLIFVLVSAVALFALRPLARRLSWRGPIETVGSGRWTGREATVEVAIPAHGDSGWVRLGRERWRAESMLGLTIPAGSRVLVTGVDGAHLTVLPLDLAEPEQGV